MTQEDSVLEGFNGDGTYIAKPHSWYEKASREEIEAEDKKVQNILQGARILGLNLEQKEADDRRLRESERLTIAELDTLKAKVELLENNIRYSSGSTKAWYEKEQTLAELKIGEKERQLKEMRG
jgi:hypothetical protein